MSITDSATTEDRVSILSFDDIEEDYALPGRIQHWLSQQCPFGLEEKELPRPYGIGGPGEFLSTMLNHRDSSSTISEEGDEAALRADSPLLGFGVEDERTLMDPLHFPSPTYVRDLPDFYRTPSSSHSHSTSSSSSPRRTLGLPPLSRRPSLLRQPSLPLLGELDDESQPQAISPSIIPPHPGRSRTQSNASISSFHLPTSMQLSHQITPPLTPISPPPFIWRHTRKPNTPSTLASFSFGGDSPGGVRSRPPSQLHHGPFHPTHRPPQKIPRTLSRSSSALSLLSLSTNNRNAVYIDEMIDIDSGAYDYVMENGEDGRLQARNEEEDQTALIPPTNTSNTDEVLFNPLRSSQVYLGTGTSRRTPTRPPHAPPLTVEADEKGGLGGVGVINEDAIEERDQFLEGDHGANTIGGGIYSYHRQTRRPPHRHSQFEAIDVGHRGNDFDADTDVNLQNEAERNDSEGEDNKPFMSRWSLTSSIGEIPTFAGSGVVAAFSVGGGGGGGGSGLFGSRKRMSYFGGDKFDKAKGIDEGSKKGGEEKEKEKVPNFAERLEPTETEMEREKNSDKKRSRLVSFISRISSNVIAPPPLPKTPPLPDHHINTK